jgi:hypothetical protein
VTKEIPRQGRRFSTPKGATMKLMTQALRRKIPALYAQERETDPIVYIKLFSVFMDATWFITEYDGEDCCFGYSIINGDEEFGYCSLSELASAMITVLGQPCPTVERDRNFEPIALSMAKQAYEMQRR